MEAGSDVAVFDQGERGGRSPLVQVVDSGVVGVGVGQDD